MGCPLVSSGPDTLLTMAAALAFRLALWAATGLTAVRIAQGFSGPPIAKWQQWLYDLLSDDTKSDETKSAEASARLGTMVEVTTFPGPFSLRKLHVIWGRGSGAALPEDDAICTFHFLKLVGAAPSDDWTDANFLRCEQLFDAAWGALQGRYCAGVTLREYRWYEAGPEIEAALGGQGRTGPPRRVVARDVPGSSSSQVAAPPQVAISITEKTNAASAWGRFYLPNPAATTDTFTEAGRIEPAFQVLLATAFESMYDTLRSESLPVVVYSQAKSARPSAGGGTLPAIGARALTVDQLQVDDIADVIRSRRYNTPLLREIRDINP